MDTARQILRFSIPGSIFLLYGTVCYLLYRRIEGVAFVEASNAIQDNVAAVIAVAATIPVGFLIYQLYYFSYEPVLKVLILPWRGKYVRRDRGGTILRTLEDDQLTHLESIFGCRIEREPLHDVVSKKSLLNKLMVPSGILEVAGPTKALPMKGKKRQRTFEDRWYTHWHVLRSAMDIAASYNEQVKAEYTTLSDIYHSLGAARTAVVSAWLSASVLFGLSHHDWASQEPWKAAAGFVAITLVTAFAVGMLYVARGRTWRTVEASVSYGLRWVLWRHADELGLPPTE